MDNNTSTACLLSPMTFLLEFFSFGTNDLTQMTYGFSRDDASKFLSDYYKNGIFDEEVRGKRLKFNVG